MRILVTGSRDWTDRDAVYRALNWACESYRLNFKPDRYGNTMPDPSKVTVVHGHCRTGADAIADDWCVSAFLEPERHPADWNGPAGKGAGFARNAEMVASGVDLCLAFIKNNSKGATHAAQLAQKAGIRTIIVRDQ
jgi:hypothetical protein